jgi:hypothetical protein
VEKVAILGQMGVVAKGGAQGATFIAIAGDHVDRRLQWRQDLAHMLVLLGQAVLHDVAGVDHRIRLLAIDVGDTSPKIVRPAPTLGPVRRSRQDVGITDLGNNHGIESTP